VIERTTISRNIEIERIGGSIVRHVQPGDTLYSIAFAMNLDPNQVAAWNGISDTGNLRVGQRIRLTEPIDFEPEKSSQVNVLEETSIVAIPIEPAENSNSDSAPEVDGEISKANSPIEETSSSRKIGDLDVNLVPQTEPYWNWPLDGQVISTFSQADGRQGIDILGINGQAVFSTGLGEVVYVGNGLKGYGNLVIIKHNDAYLSAYAHNSEIFVREGEQVSARQRIATIGVNRNRQTALHFQIRKNGQPVNPLSYLSKSD